mmetsp:Transcript_11404/g.22348  ORF Transcript_11404/g.22348 Transcript_11404/m.22348 type:complete len:225 (-) Transcript_11404:1614-2288(-)
MLVMLRLVRFLHLSFVSLDSSPLSDMLPLSTCSAPAECLCSIFWRMSTRTCRVSLCSRRLVTRSLRVSSPSSATVLPTRMTFLKVPPLPSLTPSGLLRASRLMMIRELLPRPRRITLSLFRVSFLHLPPACCSSVLDFSWSVVTATPSWVSTVLVSLLSLLAWRHAILMASLMTSPCTLLSTRLLRTSKPLMCLITCSTTLRSRSLATRRRSGRVARSSRSFTI